MRGNWITWAAAGALVLGAACGSPEEVGDGGSGSSGTESGSSGGGNPGMTGQVSVGQSTGPGTTGVDPDSSGGMDSLGFISDGTTDEPPGMQPNGGLCGSDVECVSGHCYTGGNPLGGVCSECGSDADCETGSCQFDFGAGQAACTDGTVGNGCNGDEGCAEGLVCADPFGTGFGDACSECSDAAPCPMGQICVIVLDNGPFDAYFGCVDEGTAPLGDNCPVVGGVGDGSVCMSGECGVISAFMGMFEIGVCSECDSDMDCGGGQTCQPPDFTMGMLVPGMCV